MIIIVILLNNVKKYVKKNNTCKGTPKKCSKLKPQPGKISNRIINRFNCNSMTRNILSDNPSIKPCSFYEKCPKGYYKGAMVIEKNKTYHFYRQDNNVLWSHKPGILSVTNLDASNNVIYVPHLCDKDYKKNKDKGIKYNEFCSYFCVPINILIKTKSK